MGSNTEVLFTREQRALNESYSWDSPENYPRSEVIGFFRDDSTNNHWYRDHQPGETVDRGSPWTAFSSSVSKDPVAVNVQCHSGIWFGFQGPALIHNKRTFDQDDFLALFDDWSTSELNLLGLGSEAISKVIPTNPVSDLPTAVAEILGEGLGVPGRSLLGGGGAPGGYADEYLNHVWGTLPLLSDIQKFRKATQRAEELIARYAAKSGKLIRRRYDFPEVNTSTEEVHTTSIGQWFGNIKDFYIRDFLTPAYQGYPGVKTVTQNRVKKTWFSGAFTYYLPEVGSGLTKQLDREYAEMRYLYGGISANTAWELLPYSWAVDWFTNAGDVIHNVNAFAQDGLVMPWGYIMESCEIHETRKVEGAYFGRMGNPGDGYFAFSGPVTDTFSAKFLRRRKATPFGFGLTYDGFTTRQKSILAALGISRFL